MTVATCVCLAASALILLVVATVPVVKGDGEPCQPDKLTVYKVVLHTFWSRDKFPKHYPDWRPPAQWSKVFGRSHDKSFTLFRLGQQSSNGVKAFAETGRSDLLEEQSQGEGGIYDEFNAPPITAGVGRTEAEFFVDGNHSRVSLISRIVPSPDWFIGIDSFDLCVNGNWLDSITIEVDPIDAGTDNGFTFTAPNWPTDPQGVAYRITSRYPAHPAGSFFYPNMKRLPAIGTFQFIKVKEYELSEVFHHTEDDQHYEVLKMEHMTQNSISAFNGNGDIEAAIEEERKEQEIHQRQRIRPKFQSFYASSQATTVPSATTTENRLLNTINQRDEALGITAAGVPAVVPRGDKDAIMNSIVDSYRNHSKDQHRKKYRKPKKNKRPPRDCRVSEWSNWSPCSKSCGIGEMQRRRDVLKYARRGGRLCPPLLETKWCGSARACNKGYFNW
ncbi:PREDICTED: spondin-2 [Nicrophorus vespilloides]|uniref:Spondin-2 n=1 Tax=Nicrophorus vespilloides TaxID=110193 RepID=A0ABM1M4K5_NICVS|nr:PREDICTED: spondin-2 [Nicrophorus vespilloides]